MKLLIKGNTDEAVQAAEAHGLTVVHQSVRSVQGNGTWLEVAGFPAEIVATWFSERSQLIMGFGFEPGTLLYYIIEK